MAAALPAGDRSALLGPLPAEYRQAVRVHDTALAARLRDETALLAEQDPSLAALARTVAKTSDELRPWPPAARVAALAGTRRTAPASRPSWDAVRDSLAAVAHARDRQAAVAGALHADALSRGLPVPDGTLDGVMAALAAHRDPAPAAARASDAVTSAQQAAGDVHIGRATVVSDAAVLVFREGLEAVLILAAITASFTGERRRLRRPVLLGGLAGLAATAVTWGIAQLVVRELGTGGLRLEAVTGLLAIVVLLIVTNWFFHRVYWSQWIARFNRRRKAIERVGFLSGQVAALALLGLTSVYREGFETVLFLQNLQVSAGTAACLAGAGIGLAATFAVGAVTFVAQRKLPYRKMLIATGVLIAIVLAVMTGTTVHVMQQLGWLPATPAGTPPIWASRWLGVYGTWEGIAAQLAAPAFVLGSYFVARELNGAQRRSRRRDGRRRRRAPASSGSSAAP